MINLTKLGSVVAMEAYRELLLKFEASKIPDRFAWKFKSIMGLDHWTDHAIRDKIDQLLHESGCVIIPTEELDSWLRYQTAQEDSLSK